MTPHAFDFPDADICLRPNSEGSTNNIEFRVYRCVLSAASPFFESMLSLPQPPSADTEELPVIPFVESAFVVEVLLRYIYPLPDFAIETLDEVALVLEAARKYDVAAAMNGLRRRLIAPEFLRTSSLRVYALANRYDLDDEARVAATATLSQGLHGQPLHDDLKGMNAYAYHRLIVMHEQRAKAAIDLLRLPSEVRCMLCNGRRNMNEPPQWWPDYQARAKEELRVRPTGDVIFSLGFLQKSVVAGGCERCAGSILASHWFFDILRQKIDALPTTI